MSVYTLERKQRLPISITKAWDFFSSPKNLKEITPDYMGFDIVTKDLSERMYSGMKIEYIVKPVLRIPLHWETEILEVDEPNSFVDEQRKGPYKLWHHQHLFKEIEGGVEMTDKVDYELPLGLLGNIGHNLFVRKQLSGIFDYRFTLLAEKFGKLD